MKMSCKNNCGGCVSTETSSLCLPLNATGSQFKELALGNGNIRFTKTIWDNRRTTAPVFGGSFDIVGDTVETVYIKRVLYNAPVVVVWWSDGTTTKSKARGGDEYSPETGLMYCILKKIAPRSTLDDITSDWIPDQVPMEWKMQYVDIKDVRAKHK